MTLYMVKGQATIMLPALVIAAASHDEAQQLYRRHAAPSPGAIGDRYIDCQAYQLAPDETRVARPHIRADAKENP